jgi:hypothetical protein
MHVAKRVEANHLRGRSIRLFGRMVSGSMSSFAKRFGRFVLNTMSGQIFGTREVVYLAYVREFFAAAAKAAHIMPEWEIEVEPYARAGDLDLIMQHVGDKHAVIHEYKQVKPWKKDNKERYGQSTCRQITQHARDALIQINTKRYRSAIRDDVTELREFGIAFLGQYCAVEGRLLRRERGGAWVVEEEYTAEQDEARRAKDYGPTLGAST